MLAELPVILPGFTFDELTMPRYRGPLILILGGSAMLAVSLFLSLIMQDRRLNQGNPTHPGPVHSYPHHSIQGTRERTTRSATTTHDTGPTGWKEVRDPPPARRPHPSRPEPAPQEAPPRRSGGVVQPVHPGGASRTGAATLAKRRTRVRKKWLRSMKRTARRAGLGTPEHLVAPGGRHALQLRHCRTCMVSRGHIGCEQERIVLENALRRFEPRGRVAEVSCDPQYGRCRFEILPGGR